MLKRLFLVIFILFLSSFSSWAVEKPAIFNVATYNLRQLNADDDSHGDGWSNRCPVIAKIIQFYDFDIFGTQEGFKSQLENLKDSLPFYDYIGVGREDGKDQGEHSAIFYNTKKFELLDKGDFWLSENPDRPGLGWDAACTRICSWGHFRHKETGKEFRFFNLHLDHVGVRARIESVLLVQQKIREFGIDIPTFLTGDFNVDQYNEMYSVLTSSDFLDDSFHTAELVFALNGTFNGWQTEGFTDSRIDHIFVTKDIAVEKYGVLTDTYRTKLLGNETSDSSTVPHADKPDEINVVKYRARIPSDHFPVLIKVEL